MASLRRVLGHFYSAKKKLLCRPSRPVRIDIKTRQQQSRHPLAIGKERKKPLDEARTVLLCVCVGPLFDGRTGGIDWVGGICLLI